MFKVAAKSGIFCRGCHTIYINHSYHMNMSRAVFFNRLAAGTEDYFFCTIPDKTYHLSPSATATGTQRQATITITKTYITNRCQVPSLVIILNKLSNIFLEGVHTLPHAYSSIAHWQTCCFLLFVAVFSDRSRVATSPLGTSTKGGFTPFRVTHICQKYLPAHIPANSSSLVLPSSKTLKPTITTLLPAEKFLIYNNVLPRVLPLDRLRAPFPKAATVCQTKYFFQ